MATQTLKGLTHEGLTSRPNDRRPTTTVPVELQCLACDKHVIIRVATRGEWAALTNTQRTVLDRFVSQHAAAQIAPRQLV